MSIRDNMIQQVLGNPGKYSIQQLEAAMKSGSLPAYVVVPIIQDKVQQQKQMQAAMAMQQQPPQSTVAEQVMQEAGQMGGGVEQLPSNLPEQYASGGIVAFDEGGEVERFSGGGRSQYEEHIRRRAAEFGVDPDMAMRLFATESSFDPNAVSPKGAVGLGQLMKPAASEMGLSPEERTDPFKNIDASLGYFGKQLKKYGSPDLAAVAYNYGPGNLDKHLQRYGALNPDALPIETQGYLGKLGFSPKVAAALTQAMPVSSAVAGEPQSATSQDPLKTIPRMGATPATEDSSTPFGRGIRSFMSGIGEDQTNAELQQAVAIKFGPKASLLGGLMSQSDEERQAAQKIIENVRSLPTAELRMVLQQPTAVDAVKAIGASRAPDQVERAAVARAAAQTRAAQPQEKAAPAAAPGAGGPRSFSEIFEGVPAPETESPMNLFKRYVEPMKAKFEANEEGRKAEVAKLRSQVGGELYQDLEKSLRKEAEEMGADKETARNMAIFKAGLVMMAGTSRNALQNIGKGAMVGAEDWQKASSEIKKAQKENQRMLAHIESARRAEKRGDIEQQIAEMDRAADRQQRMDQYLASGAFAAGVKTEEMALDVFGKRLTSATSQFGAQEKGENTLLAAMLRGAGREGMSESQMTKLRGDIIKDLKGEDFELQKYRALVGNPKLTPQQAQQIATDPKNAKIVEQVERARRAEIERRLREQLGKYPDTPAAQAAPATSGIRYLGTQ